MRKTICVYSDMHGNIEALQNLMKTDDYKNADMRVFLGDAVAMCPYPEECVKTLFNSGDIWLMGNHDSYMAFGLPVEEYQYFKAEKREHQAYMRNKVPENLREKMKTLPKEHYFEIGDKKSYFTHYAWESERLIADELQDNSGENLDNLFSNVNADYIIFGHEHNPFTVKGNRATYICVGTLGMKCPGNYVLIEIDENDVKIVRKNIDFDVKNLQKQMLEQNYPRAQKYSKWLDQ